jgi:hypothetical protein
VIVSLIVPVNASGLAIGAVTSGAYDPVGPQEVGWGFDGQNTL